MTTDTQPISLQQDQLSAPTRPTRSPDVLPPGVAQFSVRLHEGGSLEPFVVFGDIELPPELLQAVPGRRRQYLAGRLCATRALWQLTATRQPVRIGRRPGGAPAWPAGFTGSITHTDDFASAAVARLADASAIGIDSERIIVESRVHGVLQGATWPSEIAIARTAGCSRLEAVTLVFSAKETVFKCLVGRVGRTFAFHDVRLEGIDPAQRTFEVRIVKSLSAEFHANRRLIGRFDLTDEHVHTGMVLFPFE